MSHDFKSNPHFILNKTHLISGSPRFISSKFVSLCESISYIYIAKAAKQLPIYIKKSFRANQFQSPLAKIKNCDSNSAYSLVIQDQVDLARTGCPSTIKGLFDVRTGIQN